MPIITEAMPDYVSPYLDSFEKRMSDVLLGSALTVASAPIEGATALLLREVLDEGPLLFTQERTGGLEIGKLRTMYLRPQEVPIESVWESSSRHDPRIPTKWGIADFARSTGADEFPQLRQVVRGALLDHKPRLHLIGLRPLIEAHADEMHDEIVFRGHKELARRWRELHDIGPKGAISPAATYYKGRATNTEIDPVAWAKMEYGYCVNATPQIDRDMVAYTCGKLAAGMTRRFVLQRLMLGPA